MLAAKNPSITEAANTIYQISEDERIRQQCEAREDYLRRQRGIQRRMAKLDEVEKVLAEKEEELAEKEEELAEKEEELAEKEEALAEKKKELAERDKLIQEQQCLIEELRRQLEA